MPKQWFLKQIDDTVLPSLPHYPQAVLKLLAQRDLTDESDIQDFLNPDYGKMHDPFLFKDMQRAVERILKAIATHEKILIFADYDADAITACATVYQGLKKLGILPEYYIPDRFTEGYGMSVEAVRKIAETGVKVIITVDCGTNSVEEAKVCKDLGIDLIITDHHEITGDLPDSYALINPKNSHDNYPFPYLTGVGVAFKLIQALYSHNINFNKNEISEGWEKWLLDLVAIGTVADCQSLVSENRILVSYGLRVLSKTKWIGLRAILESSGIKNGPDEFTLGFVIAPRINAAGRIKHADIALRTLIADNVVEAQNLATELNDLNAHRQALTEQITSEAREQIEMISDKKVLLVAGKDWPKGVVGLVAGRLTEEFAKPVLVMEKGEFLATGSARSVSNFNIVEALNFSKDLLTKYGGHDQAAGYTLPNENIELLYQKLLEFADKIEWSPQDPVLKIDLELKSSDLSWRIYSYLEKFAPFGIGNPKIRLVTYGMEIVDMRTVGAGNHIKMKLKIDGIILEAIGFRLGFWFNQLALGDSVDVVYELTSNEWNGHKDLQLKVIDIKMSER